VKDVSHAGRGDYTRSAGIANGSGVDAKPGFNVHAFMQNADDLDRAFATHHKEQVVMAYPCLPVSSPYMARIAADHDSARQLAAGTLDVTDITFSLGDAPDFYRVVPNAGKVRPGGRRQPERARHLVNASGCQ
jgi:hypothetical protein